MNYTRESTNFSAGDLIMRYHRPTGYRVSVDEQERILPDFPAADSIFSSLVQLDQWLGDSTDDLIQVLWDGEYSPLLTPTIAVIKTEQFLEEGKRIY